MSTPFTIGNSNKLGQTLCQVFRFVAWKCFVKLFIITATLVLFSGEAIIAANNWNTTAVYFKLK